MSGLKASTVAGRVNLFVSISARTLGQTSGGSAATGTRPMVNSRSSDCLKSGRVVLGIATGNDRPSTFAVLHPDSVRAVPSEEIFSDGDAHHSQNSWPCSKNQPPYRTPFHAGF
jgi:hypothetical protein